MEPLRDEPKEMSSEKSVGLYLASRLAVISLPLICAPTIHVLQHYVLESP